MLASVPLCELYICTFPPAKARGCLSTNNKGLPPPTFCACVPHHPPPQLADEAVCIGEAPSSESYLSIPSIISAAISRGADAIHPVSCLPLTAALLLLPLPLLLPLLLLPLPPYQLLLHNFRTASDQAGRCISLLATVGCLASHDKRCTAPASCPENASLRAPRACLR